MVPEGQAEEPQGSGRQPIPPAKRKRLQQCFNIAGQKAAQNDFDYATELFTQCVLGDPDNALYLRSFLANLQKKYDNNKRGAKLAGMRTRGSWASMKKSQMQKDWPAVMKNGIEILKINPWDASALMAMAAAGEEMGLDEIPLILLTNAFNSAAKDVDVCRACARELTARKHYDQAIACWHRVELLKPKDIEAGKQIGNLQVEKTIDRGGYEDAESSHDVATDKQASDGQNGASGQGASGQTGRKLDSQHQKLERAIKKDPSNMEPYVELSEAYFRDEAYEKAEEVLARAYEASGGDPDIREKLEDAQLRNLRVQIRAAEKERKALKDDGADSDGADSDGSKSAEAKKKHHRLRKQFDLKSLEVWGNRVERYPNDLTAKYNLGDFCKRTEKYKEAITNFQQAKNDPRWKGLCLLKLGQCFLEIKQYRLAMTQYEAALAEIPDRDADTKKEALYCAGRLAVGLKEPDLAEKHLTVLASMDYGYRDVSALLDKAAKIRNNE